MTIFHDIWLRQNQIVNALWTATSYAITDTQRRSKNGPPQEPDYIASLALDSTPLIQSALVSILPQYNINVASVFCHQTPKVQFTQSANTSCEVGDILFVYTHTTRDSRELRNAILFQAKMATPILTEHIVHKLAGPSLQLRLYRDWPEFEYLHSGNLNGEVRDVNPKAPHTGAQYLLIEPWLSESYSFFPNFGCSMPDAYLHVHNTLGIELFKLLTFQSGRAFEDSNAAARRNDWSQVVWDLITSAFGRTFNRRRSGRVAQPRLTEGDHVTRDGDSFGFEGSKLLEKIFGDREKSDYIGESDENVSVVLIETSEKEQ